MPEEKKHKIIKNINYFIALPMFLFFALFSFSKSGKNIENALYDTALKIKPEVEQREDVLLLNIDDLAIEQIGAWPWSREIFADVLIRLKELGCIAAVFDIEYLSPGVVGVDKDYIEHQLPKEYKEVQSEIKEYINEFSDSVENKNIPLNQVKNFGTEMSDYLESRVHNLSDSVSQKVFKDNDIYMGKAVRFFGHAFLTINAVEINKNESNQKAKEFAYNNFMFSNVEDEKKFFEKETEANRKRVNEVYGIAPAILPILENAKGAGFPNVVIDTDGVRRRIPLLNEYKGKYIGQLVFAPILDILKPEKIIRKKSSLILKKAKKTGSSAGTQDIVIPLDESGNLLINWLKKPFADSENPENGSFRNLSIYAVVYTDILEKNLLHTLSDIHSLNIRNASGYLPYHAISTSLQNEYSDLNLWKEALLNGEREDYTKYFEARISFFNNVDTFLKGKSEEEIHNVFKSAKNTSNAQIFEEADIKISVLFDNARNFYKNYIEHKAYVEKHCRGAFSIIGYSGVGTSDLGVNPFWNSYPNVGTHANVYNTIMNESFITPVPVWISLFLSFVFVLLSAYLLKKLEHGYVKVIFGSALTLFIFMVFIFLFSFFNIYIKIFVPIMSVALSFILISFFNFIFTEKEKSFLRKAFGVYLSDDVVNEIVLDPTKLSLGGEEKRITALFTDIKSFSTLSEKITPEHLVSVLNIYLTKMSDLILEEKGTIDKYIGDAIVSFFGAPIDLPEHASKACLAALKMKNAEEEINKELYGKGFIPMPIFTRIGINTGNMVVGNMGTEKKMNYTIMGNDVNMAARLEGVNKKYGTAIMVSESTWNETNGMFLGRRLDRVRVVGINTPVQLYNIMAVKSEAGKNLVKFTEIFEEGISFYRERKYENALEIFKTCIKLFPKDEPSKIYAERMQSLVDNPSEAEKHDDVVNMTSK